MDTKAIEKARKATTPTEFREQSERNIDALTVADLWVLIVRRKKTVFAFFLALALAAAALAFLSTPVYESRAVVRVGQLNYNVRDLGSAQAAQDSVEDLVEQLKEEHRLNDGDDRPFPLVHAIKSNRGAKNIITITAHGHSPEEARDFLANATNKLLSDLDVRRARVHALVEGRMKVVQSRIKEAENQIRRLNGEITSINKTNAAAAGVLTMEQSSLLKHLGALERHGGDLAVDLNQLEARGATLLREPTLLRSPIKPKPMLYILLGAILGLVLGILAALFLELRSSGRLRTFSE